MKRLSSGSNSSPSGGGYGTSQFPTKWVFRILAIGTIVFLRNCYFDQDKNSNQAEEQVSSEQIQYPVQGEATPAPAPQVSLEDSDTTSK